MRSYSDITLKYLQKNRKRTVLTIIGIILSLSLISGIGFLGLSFNDYMYERTIRNNGDYEFLIRGLNKEQINILKNDVDLEKIAVDGYSSMYIYDNNDDKEIIIDILPEDKASLTEVFVNSLEEGRYPGNNKEIVLGSSAKESLKISIGDTVKLNEYKYDEELEKSIKTGNIEEFKVVGFIVDRIISNGTYFSGYTLLEELDENETYSAYFSVINKKDKINIAIEKIGKLLNKTIDRMSMHEEGLFVNNELLALKGESNYVGINTVIKFIVIFVLVIIIFATIFLIYNAINISVTERIRHFGIIRSLGATPNQIRNIVLKEGVIMCLLVIPFGVIFGFLGVWVTVKLLQNQITLLLGDGIFKVKFYPVIIIFTAILGIITILLSSYGPARKAGGVSPINIIKGNGDKEKIKYYKGKVVRKIFGIEGWLAYKNIRKNSKRFVVTILSLSISLIMFITFSNLNMKRIAELDYINKATLDHGSVYVYEQEADKEIEERLKSIDGIDKVYSRFYTQFPIVLENSMLTKEFKETYPNRYTELSGERVTISTFNDEVFKYIGMEDELKGNEIVLVNNIARYDNEGKLSKIDIINIKEGDSIKIPKACIDFIIDSKEMGSEEEKKLELDILNSINKDENYEFKVKKIIDRNPFSPENSYSLEVIVSEEFMKPFRDVEYIGSDSLGFRYPDINNYNEIKRIASEVEAIVADYDSGFIDNSERNRSIEEMWTVVNVFIYGFIVMITLIGVVNVINTISLNILLKKKEFGTLGTIGMEKRQLYKMVILEGLLHGIISCIIGGIIAVGLSFIAIKIVSYGFTFGNTLYWQPFIIGFAINLIVVIIASLIPLNKLKKMSLVETIRNVE